MGFTIIEVALTDEQLGEINAAVGDGPDSGQQFALLAQPWVRGNNSGSMSIYVMTPEQYKVIDVGVREARKMIPFIKD